MRIFSLLRQKLGFSPLVYISPLLVKLSEYCIDYANRVQEESNNKSKRKEKDFKPLTRDVFTGLHEQMVNYHRAILCLAENGWAHTVNPLIRSMIEVFINAIVIGKGGHDSEFRSFQYVIFDNLRDSIKDKNGDLFKKQMLDINKTILPLLSEVDKKRAEELLKKDKFSFYWYSEWYSGPRDVIKREAPDLADIYEISGSASHGGTLGFKLFDDLPIIRNIGPRQNAFNANMSIIFGVRYLLEFTLTRSHFEELDMEDEYRQILDKLIKSRVDIEKLRPYGRK